LKIVKLSHATIQMHADITALLLSSSKSCSNNSNTYNKGVFDELFRVNGLFYHNKNLVQTLFTGKK